MVQISANIMFNVAKKPCQKFLVEKRESEIVIKWIPAKVGQKIYNPDELATFIGDTEKLIYYCLVDQDNDNELIKRIKAYWLRWGPLIPIKRNSRAEYCEISLGQLLVLMWTCYAFKEIWTCNDEMLREVERLNNITRIMDFLEGISSTAFGNIERKYWYPVPNDNFLNNGDNCLFKWEFSEKIPDNKLPILYFPNIPAEFEFQEEKINWVREAVLQCIANYLRKQSIRFTPEVRGDEIYLIGHTQNLYLAYFISSTVGNRRFMLCPACSQLLPDSEAYKKTKINKWYKEQKTPRKLKKRLRYYIHSGEITHDQYKDWGREINDLFEQGMEESEIWSMIRKRILKQRKQES